MSETLAGVIVGGLIASIGSFTQLVYSHQRWKKETKLLRLKELRDRMETKHTEFMERFSNCLFEGKWSPDVKSEISVSMPEKAQEYFYAYMDSKDKSIEAKRSVLHDVARELKSAVAEIEGRIDKLLD